MRHLASAVLGQGLERLRRDWPRRYGAPVWLVESFVDRTRFGGASYRAANWVAIGWTRGYAKQQGQFHYHGQPKEVYVYVIEKRIRQLLTEDPAQGLLTREFLLARRPPGNPQPQARRTIMSEVLQSWAPKVPPQWNLSPEDLEHVGQELHEFIGEFDDTFGRIEPAGLCRLYVQGLLSGTARKNVEAMALGLESPNVVRNLQRFMSEYEWNEGRMRNRHWQLSAQSLADEQGVWSIDASEFPKKGKESVGVAPQYCGALGKTANCQSGVFICYSGPKGHALLNARLYLPQCWFSEAHRERREKKCRVPREVVFQTKPQIAMGTLQRALENQALPGSVGRRATLPSETMKPSWTHYPRDALPGGNLLHPQGMAQARTAAPAWETEGGTVEQLLEEKDLLNWQSRKIAEGEKGPIVAGFARVRVYLSRQRTPESERTLLLRNDPDGRIKYALSNAPESVALSELIRVSAARWPIERCFQEDKSELGLDHYEHRSWAAWHRHMRLVFLAHLFLTRLRLKYKKSPGPDVAASSSLAGMELASPDARPRLRPGLRPLPSVAQPLRLPIPSQTSA